MWIFDNQAFIVSSICFRCHENLKKNKQTDKLKKLITTDKEFPFLRLVLNLKGTAYI